MFQRISLARVEDNRPIYTVLDSCFAVEIEAESAVLLDTIANSACAEALIYIYESKRLNVAKNLAAYYAWLVRQIYGKPLPYVVDMYLNDHNSELTKWVPNFQFSKKYHLSVKHYLTQMGCYP
jgi:hypothetical protein